MIDLAQTHLPAGFLRDLLTQGVLTGVGSVVVFLPQIVILFAFILALEESGYLPRAAFLLDRLMSAAGLSGRSFIPLLSSFACAIPGIMATRTIVQPRDRLATIMLAPLMTCSARLPVYALLIGAFVPARSVGPFNLRGLTLFGLYVAGVGSAMAVGWLIKRVWLKNRYQPLILELPPYRLPSLAGLDADAAQDLLRRKSVQLIEKLSGLRLVRRGMGATTSSIKHGPLVYDQAGRVATIDGRMVELSARELGLLEVLLQRAGRLVSKDQLVERLCEWGEEVSNNAIEVYIHRLRKKIEKGPIRIATVRGLGYCLEKLPG